MITLSRVDVVWRALREAVEDDPERVGYVYQGRNITFREMDEITDRVASGLLHLGFQKGDRIGVIALTQPEWLFVYFAAAKIGAIVVGLSVRYRETELHYMLNQSEARAVVALRAFGDMDYVRFFEGFRERIPSVERFLFLGGEGFSGSTSFDTLMNAEVDEAALQRAKAAVAPVDPVMIIYTSGTTGRPKGAVLTHKSQLASARGQAEHTVDPEADDDDNRYRLIPLPLNHVGGITCGVVSCLLIRETCVLIPVFDSDAVIENAIQYRPRAFGGVPAVYHILMLNARFGEWDKTNVELLTTGGSNAEPALVNQLMEIFPNAAYMNLYGLSESSGAVIMSPRGCPLEKNIHSIGKPLADFRIKVVNAQGHELPAGETGELCIQGGAVGGGYFRMPEETAETFDPEGWLHTGDMAYLDEDGYAYLKGRKKEMYIQGGFNVYPVEVENLLAKHPKVMVAAGIGVPDPVLGEVGRYYIVPKPGTEPTAEEITDYCRKHLADYKVPRQVVFRDDLPMTPVGKIMKSKLKEEYDR
jgi:fatty-acyl-CoA synthase